MSPLGRQAVFTRSARGWRGASETVAGIGTYAGSSGGTLGVFHGTGPPETRDLSIVALIRPLRVIGSISGVRREKPEDRGATACRADTGADSW